MLLSLICIFSSEHATLKVTVGWSVTLWKFTPESYLNRITSLAHPYATDAVIYRALFYLPHSLVPKDSMSNNDMHNLHPVDFDDGR